MPYIYLEVKDFNELITNKKMAPEGAIYSRAII